MHSAFRNCFKDPAYRFSMSMPAPNENFQAYVDELSLRMLQLETSAISEMKNDVRRLETMKALFLEYQQEAHRLRMELDELRAHLVQSERVFSNVVRIWQQTARKEDLARVDDRINAWPLEFFAHRPTQN
jgi:hypothetical protein